MNFGLRLFRQLYKQPLARLCSTKLPAECTIFQDNDMIICWHPEPLCPYECSKPIPVKKSLPEGVLKIGEKEVKAVFQKPKQELIPEELAKITYTCKHLWYPKARTKKIQRIERERPYM